MKCNNVAMCVLSQFLCWFIRQPWMKFQKLLITFYCRCSVNLVAAHAWQEFSGVEMSVLRVLCWKIGLLFTSKILFNALLSNHNWNQLKSMRNRRIFFNFDTTQLTKSLTSQKKNNSNLNDSIKMRINSQTKLRWKVLVINNFCAKIFVVWRNLRSFLEIIKVIFIRIKCNFMWRENVLFYYKMSTLNHTKFV